MKRTQKGFSVIEGLLILIIIGLIGFIGWYVWDSKNKTDKSLQSANTSSNVNLKLPKKSTTAAKGSITGHLGYPAGSLPAMKVCAVMVGGSSTQPVCFDNPLVGGTDKLAYKVDVAAGDYYVYAQLKNKTGDITPTYKAYYDEYVKCGAKATCPAAGHTQYIKVTVKSGATTADVDPTDWYAQ